MIEEAKITDTIDNNDSLLSVDDLIMEIGRMHVEKMSSEKKVKVILSKQAQKQVEIAPIVRSNEQYKENNRNLDRALAELRSKYGTLERTHSTLDRTHSTLDRTYNILVEEVKGKDVEIANNLKAIEELSKTVDKLKPVKVVKSTKTRVRKTAVRKATTKKAPNTDK